MLLIIEELVDFIWIIRKGKQINDLISPNKHKISLQSKLSVFDWSRQFYFRGDWSSITREFNYIHS
jgi:hypothetical protein